MPNVNFAAINWLMVLVSGVGVFMVGGLWYTALFGKLWVRMQGYTSEQVADMQKRVNPLMFYGGMAVCYVVMAAGLAVILRHLDVETVAGALGLGVAVWVAAAGLYMTNVIATQKPMGLFVVDAGFYLVAIEIAALILTVWR